MKTIKNKNYSSQHTIKRLQERYGVIITPVDYDNLCSVARSGTLISTEKQKDSAQYVYDINFKNQLIRVVWDELRNCITTVLPMR